MLMASLGSSVAWATCCLGWHHGLLTRLCLHGGHYWNTTVPELYLPVSYLTQTSFLIFIHTRSACDPVLAHEYRLSGYTQGISRNDELIDPLASLFSRRFLTHLPTSHTPCLLPIGVPELEPGAQACALQLAGCRAIGIGLYSQLPDLQKQEPGRNILMGTNENLQ